MIWKDFSRSFRDGDHAFLSPSTHSWFNYDDEKLVQSYVSKLAAARGTALHALACNLIKMKVHLPSENRTLNMYVNDAIYFKMRPEEKLYYSKFCYGTTDCISYEEDPGILRIHDLKTGKTRASFLQLEIYAALFFLCYTDYEFRNTKEIELRIYQNDEVLVEHREIDDILPVMDKIKRYSRILEELEGKCDEFNSFGGGS